MAAWKPVQTVNQIALMDNLKAPLCSRYHTYVRVLQPHCVPTECKSLLSSRGRHMIRMSRSWNGQQTLHFITAAGFMICLFNKVLKTIIVIKFKQDFCPAIQPYPPRAVACGR